MNLPDPPISNGPSTPQEFEEFRILLMNWVHERYAGNELDTFVRGWLTCRMQVDPRLRIKGVIFERREVVQWYTEACEAAVACGAGTRKATP